MAQDPQIPIVNLNGSNAAQELLQAASDNGFIFVEHGDDVEISPDQVEDMFQSSREFFAAPTPVKAECAINSAKSGTNHGWLGPGTETLDPGKQKRPDQKEAFNIGSFDPETHHSKTDQPLPVPLQPHREQISLFMKNCHALCNRILTLLASALDMQDEQWFSDRHRYADKNSSILRLLYYPAPRNDTDLHQEDIRAGAHSDYGSLTLLFRLPGQPGLEILTKDDKWAAVPVNPSSQTLTKKDDGITNGHSPARLPILVNIGDVLSYWTKGLLKSTVHRVVFPAPGEGGSHERYSIAYFCHPDDDAELIEVPSRVVKDAVIDGERGAKPIAGVKTAKDHLNARLAATYGIK